ncbi:MAG TPA: DUF2382 domain-containing protein [Thermomicrobiales bacterium]|jgi:uncharacterized protein (TIGR02271 family)|nr:DUF2382 domain-containing protein [Thermomicrobiales bacterium]
MSTNQDWVVQPGTNVYGSDQNKIGEVDDIQDGYLIVRKGFFFPKDHYIPFSAIANHTEDSIYLNVTADEATNQQWDTQPEGYVDRSMTSGATGGTTTAYAANDLDNAAVPGTTGSGAMGADRADDQLFGDTGVADTATTTDAYAASTTGTTGVANESAPFEHSNHGTGHIDESDDIRVPVVEEELAARTRGVERGQVHVETRVSEAEQTLEVPVTEERVRVDRVRVNRDATAEDLSVDGATIDVPVYGEEVDVDKRARVVEEVQISKEAVQETRAVSDTVRREDVDVIEDTDTTGRRTTR